MTLSRPDLGPHHDFYMANGSFFQRLLTQLAIGKHTTKSCASTALIMHCTLAWIHVVACLLGFSPTLTSASPTASCRQAKDGDSSKIRNGGEPASSTCSSSASAVAAMETPPAPLTSSAVTLCAKCRTASCSPSRTAQSSLRYARKSMCAVLRQRTRPRLPIVGAPVTDMHLGHNGRLNMA